MLFSVLIKLVRHQLVLGFALQEARISLVREVPQLALMEQTTPHRPGGMAWPTADGDLLNLT